MLEVKRHLLEVKSIVTVVPSMKKSKEINDTTKKKKKKIALRMKP